jgi:hypothetical protein
MLPLPAAAIGFRPAIAEKSLVSPVKEICGTLPLPLLAGALGELALELEAGADAGAELELELLLVQAATSSAAETAAAVRPTLFPDTEYNGVPRLLSRHANGHVRDQIRMARSLLTGALLAEMLRPSRETFPLTRS